MKAEQGLIIDKKWIEDRIKELEKNRKYYNTSDHELYSIDAELKILKEILANSKPLLPILEETFKHGEGNGREEANWDHLVNSPTNNYMDWEEYLNNLDI